eukprot:m.175187 g.175187  ORF g.175187 m.175187 type:complete len:594 (-) comp17915_c0_seq3:323-2104(-)
MASFPSPLEPPPPSGSSSDAEPALDLGSTDAVESTTDEVVDTVDAGDAAAASEPEAGDVAAPAQPEEAAAAQPEAEATASAQAASATADPPSAPASPIKDFVASATASPTMASDIDDEEEGEAELPGPTGLIIREGYLLKEGGSYKSWKKRFFTLTDSARMLYYDRPMGKFLGGIDLLGAVVTVPTTVPNTKRQFCFYVQARPAASGTTSNKRSKYVLCADNQDIRDAWVGKIRQVSGVVRTGQAAVPPLIQQISQRTLTFRETISKKVSNFIPTTKLRHAVSKKKVRLMEDGFDLDMTYITNKIIAMGYPSMGTESMYRNKYEDVYKFLETKHRGRYRVYNLCSERAYPANKFHNRVAVFPFDDHCAPQLDTLVDIIKDVDRWLEKHDDNVVAIHCKAGKGRTGLVISCLLLHAGLATTAKEATDLFGEIRTADGQGVTIPSQHRYVGYYEQVLAKGTPAPRPLRIVQILLHTTPNFDGGSGTGCNPFFNVVVNDQLEYCSKPDDSSPVPHYVNQPQIPFDFQLDVVGDIRLEFLDWDRLSAPDQMFKICFNTAFVPEDKKIVFEREVIDDAYKEKHLKKFDAKFAVEITFE